MVVWCNTCKKYTNQICDRCGQSFGEIYCEVYGCGGRMICPICHSYDIETVAEHKKKEQLDVDKYDYATLRKMGLNPEEMEKTVQQPQKTLTCPSCGYQINPSWNYCPNCGISFKIKR